MYETFDHTADLGLRVRAPDLATLFADAGRALLSALVEEVDTVRPEREEKITLPADELEYLLIDWLKALLYRFEVERLLFSQFELAIDEFGLNGVARGEVFDPGRHELSHEVKAITYHDLEVQKTSDGWLAEVIVDI